MTDQEYPFLVMRTDVIQRLIVARNYRTYLEIGYGPGENFHAIRCVVKHAVDPHAAPSPDVIAKTSDQFFEEADAVGSRYDLIFVDGLHTTAQVLRDYKGASRCLAPGGVILFHDVNPTRAAHVRGVEEFRAEGGNWTGDVYKAWAVIRLASPYWTGTMPDEFGVGIVDTSRPAGRIDFTEPPTSFEEFAASRDRYLNPVRLDEIG